jgi:predicted RNA-binding Zn-ribbon protein involved in translation (DUF1610 family)
MEVKIGENNGVSQNQSPACPVCGNPLSLRIAKGRKSNKPFIMLMCVIDGRHFRGFIGDRSYIQQVMNQIDSKARMQECVNR